MGLNCPPNSQTQQTLVSYYVHLFSIAAVTRGPQLGSLRTTYIYSPRVLEVRKSKMGFSGLKLRCLRTAPYKSSQEEPLSLLSPASRAAFLGSWSLSSIFKTSRIVSTLSDFASFFFGHVAFFSSVSNFPLPPSCKNVWYYISSPHRIISPYQHPLFSHICKAHFCQYTVTCTSSGDWDLDVYFRRLSSIQ